MGIRINKALGWGLLNVKYEDDARINWRSPLVQNNLEPVTRDRYYSYLEDLSKTADRHNAPWGEMALIRVFKDNWEKLGHPRDRVHYWTDEENDDTGTFLLQPFGCPDWSRTDDTMDIVVSRLAGHEDVVDHTERLYSNPWPFDGTWMNKDTGERIMNHDGYLMAWVQMSQVALPPHQRKFLESDTKEALNLLSVELGFDDFWHAAEMIAPMVPHDIRNLATFGEVFTSEAAMLELRPMLYTYWA